MGANQMDPRNPQGKLNRSQPKHWRNHIPQDQNTVAMNEKRGDDE